MATKYTVIFFLVAVVTLISMASAIPGTSTVLTTYVPCLGIEDPGTMIAAANPILFNTGAACGVGFRVRYTRRTNNGVPTPCYSDEITPCYEIRVTVVGVCPGCGVGQLELSREAFSMIADPNAGRIPIEFELA